MVAVFYVGENFIKNKSIPPFSVQRYSGECFFIFSSTIVAPIFTATKLHQ